LYKGKTRIKAHIHITTSGLGVAVDTFWLGFKQNDLLVQTNDNLCRRCRDKLFLRALQRVSFTLTSTSVYAPGTRMNRW